MKKQITKKALLLASVIMTLALAIPVANLLAVPPPNRPSGLFAFPIDAGKVTVGWYDNSDNETGFNLQRATDPDFTKNLVNLPAPANSTATVEVADNNAIQVTVYYYRVQALGAANSRFSNIVRVVTPKSAPVANLYQPAPNPALLSSNATNQIKADVSVSGSTIASSQYQILLNNPAGTFSAQEIYSPQLDLTIPSPLSAGPYVNNNDAAPAGLPAGAVAEYEIVGVVGSVSGNVWSVGNPALTIYQSATTHFVGSRKPVAGDKVHIVARRTAASGPLVAMEITYKAPGATIGAVNTDVTWLYNGDVTNIQPANSADGVLLNGETWTIGAGAFRIDDPSFPAYVDDSFGVGTSATVRFAPPRVEADVARNIFPAVPANVQTPRIFNSYGNPGIPTVESNDIPVPQNLPDGAWLNVIVDGVVTEVDHDLGIWTIGEEGIKAYEFQNSVIFQNILNNNWPGVGEEVILYCHRTLTPGPLVIDQLHMILQGPLIMKPTAVEMHLMYNGAIQSMGPHTWTVGGQTFIVDDFERAANIAPDPLPAFSIGQEISVEFDHVGEVLPDDTMWAPLSSPLNLALPAEAAGRTGTLFLKAADTNLHGITTKWDVNALSTAFPAVPLNLTASLTPAPWTPGVDAVVLSWTDQATNETNYRVERSANGTTWTTVANALPAGSTGYNDTSVAADGTFYWYRVTAYNGSGSSPAALVGIATPTTPVAPSNLAGILAAGPAVNLTWQDNSNNETGFEVERGLGALPVSWTLLGAPTPTSDADVASWNDATVILGNTYTYRARAVNGWGSSTWDPVTIKVALPDTPTALNAVAVSPNQVAVTWTDASDNEQYFIVQRAPDVTGNPGVWVAVSGNLPAGTTSYNDPGLTDGATYWYRVIARNVLGDSAPSNQDSATTPLIPGAPTGLNLLAVAPDQTNLQWTENNPNTEDGYYIFRAPQVSGIPGSWNQIFTTASNTNSYQDTSCVPGTAYYYRVQAFTGGVASAVSQAGPSTTPALPAPTGIAVNTTTVQLTWADVSYEITYIVNRSTDGIIWTTITAPALAQNTTSYNDVVPAIGTYQYRLIAQSAWGDFTSNTVIVTTLPTNAPLLSAGIRSGTSVPLSWVDNSAADTGFFVYRRVVGSASWSLIATRPANAGTGGTINYTATLPSSTLSYEFRVAARVGGLYYYSNVVVVV
jgi:hypothetical protein